MEPRSAGARHSKKGPVAVQPRATADERHRTPVRHVGRMHRIAWCFETATRASARRRVNAEHLRRATGGRQRSYAADRLLHRDSRSWVREQNDRNGCVRRARRESLATRQQPRQQRAHLEAHRCCSTRPLGVRCGRMGRAVLGCPRLLGHRPAAQQAVRAAPNRVFSQQRPRASGWQTMIWTASPFAARSPYHGSNLHAWSSSCAAGLSRPSPAQASTLPLLTSSAVEQHVICGARVWRAACAGRRRRRGWLRLHRASPIRSWPRGKSTRPRWEP
jgi:hypothetical protein